MTLALGRRHHDRINSTMNLSSLFHRDLTRLVKQIEAFPNTAMLWTHLSGMTNAAGTLVLHLEGNLREYIGRQLGKVDYRRDREFEFAAIDLRKEDLLLRADDLRRLIPLIVQALSEDERKMPYPEDVLGSQLSVEGFLIHLYGHLNWHLGQIDSIRRALSGEGALPPTVL